MKKNCILISLCLILLSGMTAYGAEPPAVLQEREKREVQGNSLTKTLILPAGEITSIPRYETDGNILYILEEDSLRLRTVSTGSAEGADVVTVTKVISGLPDNDLERIPMTEEQGEISCDLLSVSYRITEESREGMPLKYEARCWYGGLSRYEEVYDTAWEASMTYTGHPIESSIQSAAVEYIYEYIERSGAAENGSAGIERTIGGGRKDILEETNETLGTEDTEETEVIEEETVPMASEETQESGRETEPGRPEDINIDDEDTPLGAPGRAAAAAAAVAGILAAGLLAALLWYLNHFTAPIYAAMYSGGYKRIGRIRLKRCRDHYAAVLTEYLTERAETDNYKIKISQYIQNRSRIGILDIRCPDGRTITRKLKDVVLFTVMD